MDIKYFSFINLKFILFYNYELILLLLYLDIKIKII